MVASVTINGWVALGAICFVALLWFSSDLISALALLRDQFSKKKRTGRKDQKH